MFWFLKSKISQKCFVSLPWRRHPHRLQFTASRPSVIFLFHFDGFSSCFSLSEKKLEGWGGVLYLGQYGSSARTHVNCPDLRRERCRGYSRLKPNNNTLPVNQLIGRSTSCLGGRLEMKHELKQTFTRTTKLTSLTNNKQTEQMF